MSVSTVQQYLLGPVIRKNHGSAGFIVVNKVDSKQAGRETHVSLGCLHFEEPATLCRLGGVIQQQFQAFPNS